MKSLRALVHAARSRLGFQVQRAILEFTESVAKQMLAGNVSKSKLAEALGCSQAFVTKVLKGRNNFTLETMVKIAHALDTELKVELVQNGAAKNWTSVFDAHQPRSVSVCIVEGWTEHLGAGATKTDPIARSAASPNPGKMPPNFVELMHDPRDLRTILLEAAKSVRSPNSPATEASKFQIQLEARHEELAVAA
jgi:transcriptional regulator with XRE-family HTH domain